MPGTGAGIQPPGAESGLNLDCSPGGGSPNAEAVTLMPQDPQQFPICRHLTKRPILPLLRDSCRPIGRHLNINYIFYNYDKKKYKVVRKILNIEFVYNF